MVVWDSHKELSDKEKYTMKKVKKVHMGTKFENIEETKKYFMNIGCTAEFFLTIHDKNSTVVKV